MGCHVRCLRHDTSVLIECWKNEVVNVPKLRTYCKFKLEFEVDPYVSMLMSKGCRSLLAQFRAGMLPLRIKTGRYQNIPLDFRLCLMCHENVCEDEAHFMFSCTYH